MSEKQNKKKKNQIEFENEEWKKELKNIMYSRNYIIEMRRKKFLIGSNKIDAQKKNNPTQKIFRFDPFEIEFKTSFMLLMLKK